MRAKEEMFDEDDCDEVCCPIPNEAKEVSQRFVKPVRAHYAERNDTMRILAQSSLSSIQQ